MRLATARTPDGDELALCVSGADYTIRIGGRELMSSRAHCSEEGLAELACAELTGTAPRVLVGGLGLGYTLRAALDCLPEAAKLSVVELVPEIVEWVRGPLAHLAGSALDDARVSIVVGDVAEAIEREAAGSGLDALLLDVDNGPGALARPANAGLYDAAGLAAAYTALRPEGGLAVWSAEPDPGLYRRLEDAGFSAEIHRIGARGEPADPAHIVYVGRKATR